MRGLLFSQMVPPNGERADFDDWYDTEHIPVRLRLDGFERAIRYSAVGDEPEHLVCYLLDDVAVLDHPEYASLKTAPSSRTRHMLDAVSGFTRYTATALGDVGDRRPPGASVVVAVDASDVSTEVVEAWLAERLVPTTNSAVGWRRTHWYRTIGGWDGPERTHFVVVDLEADVELPDSDWLSSALADAVGPGVAVEELRYRVIAVQS